MATAVLVPLVVCATVAVAVMALALPALRQGRTVTGRQRTVEPAGARRTPRDPQRVRAELRELPPAQRRRFAARWQAVQGDVVDRPDAAVDAAQALVTEVMRACGYPVDERGFVTSDRTGVMGEYRSAQRICALNERGEATTHQLRQALAHHRSLLVRLLDTRESRSVAASHLREQWPRSGQRG